MSRPLTNGILAVLTYSALCFAAPVAHSADVKYLLDEPQVVELRVENPFRMKVLDWEPMSIKALGFDIRESLPPFRARILSYILASRN